MNESYLVKELFLGNILVSSNLGGIHGPINNTSIETYIFYKKKGKSEAVEVFTDDVFKISNDGSYIFNEKYVINQRDITEYLTEDEIRLGVILKWRLIEIYNQINFEKQNSRQYKKIKKNR